MAKAAERTGLALSEASPENHPFGSLVAEVHVTGADGRARACERFLKC